MATHLAYEIQSHQMLHNDISLKKTNTKYLHLIYTFCCQQLKSVQSHCYLGVQISNTLNWTAQCNLVARKAQQTLEVIRRNLNKCPTHIKSIAYTTLVRPILEYASASWDPHCLKHIKTLERIQRQAARFCTHNYSREPGTVTQLFKDLQWDTLQTRRKIKRLSIIYKMEHNLIDIPLDHYIQHNTRSIRRVVDDFIHPFRYRFSTPVGPPVDVPSAHSAVNVH